MITREKILSSTCYFSPKCIARMEKLPTLAKYARYISPYYIPLKGNPLLEDLLKIFHVGTHGVNKKFVAQKQIKKVYAKLARTRPARGEGRGRLLVSNDRTIEVVPFAEPVNPPQQTPQFVIKRLVNEKYNHSLHLHLNELDAGIRRHMLCEIADSLTSYCCDSKENTLYTEGSSSFKHMEKIMEKNGIRRVRCVATGRLRLRELCKEVALVNYDGTLKKRTAYCASDYLRTMIMVGKLDNNSLEFVKRPSDPIQILDPDTSDEIIAHQDTGGIYPIAIIQWASTLYAIDNLNELTKFFRNARKGIIRLSTEATLMNYTTQTGISKFYKREHVHRAGFEVEVSTPYTVDSAPRVNGEILSPEAVFASTGWAPTFDRSIAPGFELKSPVISFNNTADLRNAIPDVIRNLIDSSTKGDNCGGHIHYSNTTTPADILYKFIRSWAWLFAVIYPKRINNEYCEMTDGDTRKGSEHYRWLRLRDGRIEVRVFPAFRKVNALAWRANLLAKMATIRPAHVAETISAWANDAEGIATHVFAVKKPKELLESFRSQVVQTQVVNKLAMPYKELRLIEDALSGTQDIE